MSISPPNAVRAFVLPAVLVAATLFAGCAPVNRLYKQDTGTIERVAAPSAAYTPITYPEQNGVAADDPVFTDLDATPEVLAGEGPAGIEPLGEEPVVASEPEVLETYVVQKGDTLGHISQKLFGTVGRTKDLMNANPGINPKRMQIGDVINVPR